MIRFTNLLRLKSAGIQISQIRVAGPLKYTCIVITYSFLDCLQSEIGLYAFTELSVSLTTILNVSLAVHYTCLRVIFVNLC